MVKMHKTRKGFTLIEILIVIAILGIIMALFIPQIMSAVQKSKQKGTMREMNSMAQAILDHVADHGFPPEQDGALSAGSNFCSSLSPFYLKIVPLTDEWGTPFHVYCGRDSIAGFGVDGITASASEDFLIVSFGRDRQRTPFSFNPLAPSSAYFGLTSLRSYDQDLAIWSGTWIHLPKTAQIGS